jgi:hypothetical protein
MCRRWNWSWRTIVSKASRRWQPDSNPGASGKPGAVHASLGSATTRRIVLYSEPLDAQRFAVEPLEPEIRGLLTKK